MSAVLGGKAKLSQKGLLGEGDGDPGVEGEETGKVA